MAVFMPSSQSVTLLRSPLLLPNAKLSACHHRPTAASLSFTPLNPRNLLSLSLKTTKTPLIFDVTRKSPSFKVSASVSSQTPTESRSLLTGSTRTVTSIITLGFLVSRIFFNFLQNFAQRLLILPNPQQLAAIRALQCNLVDSVGPLFFAALKDRPRGYLNTPLTVVAAGLAKWLDIYSGVLMVRVLLSWFPNIPWERQPLSAIRDLCDPYLNLFRNIIPPIFDTLDVSPLLAFAVLGTLGSILNSSGAMY
uniref:YGGT family protein n=1 Tax=Rhizophora mucronata TaxID=61149 RepID=A0A2P2NHL9_RHIMU